MAPEQKYKRTIYLVDRGYQLRFVTRLFAVVLAVAASSSVLSSILLWRNLQVPGQESDTPLVVALVAVATTLLIELLLAIPLVFVLGIRQSHRVVGPMQRIKRAIEAIGEGDFSQHLVLRQGDVLEDVARSINKMAASLQERFPKRPS